MQEFFTNYWDNRAFVILHFGVLLLSITVIVFWFRELRAIQKAVGVATVREPRSESELTRLIAPLEPFGSYFDYCSSAFIFIGLLGTILGFITGVPRMNDDKYQFEDILRALSTSGMGIVLALGFNFVTTILDFLTLRPFINGLRRKFDGDALEASIRDYLTRLENTLGTTLATFNSSVAQIIVSLDAWNATSRQTAAEITATHHSFVETHKALVSLPESIRQQLADVFSEAATSMGSTLGRIKTALESFEELPGKMEAGIDESFQKRQTALEEALTRYREGIESQRSSLDELYAKLKALPLEAGESLSKSNAKSLALMEQSHAAFLGSLKTAVRATVEDQVAVLGALAGQMDLNAETLRKRWDELLVSERNTFEEAVLSALRATMRTIEEQRKKLLTMESTLPESLANTFHTLIAETQAATQSLNEATKNQSGSISQQTAVLEDFSAAIRGATISPPAGGLAPPAAIVMPAAAPAGYTAAPIEPAPIPMPGLPMMPGQSEGKPPRPWHSKFWAKFRGAPPQ